MLTVRFIYNTFFTGDHAFVKQQKIDCHSFLHALVNIRMLTKAVNVCRITTTSPLTSTTLSSWKYYFLSLNMILSEDMRSSASLSAVNYQEGNSQTLKVPSSGGIVRRRSPSEAVRVRWTACPMLLITETAGTSWKSGLWFKMEDDLSPPVLLNLTLTGHKIITNCCPSKARRI